MHTYFSNFSCSMSELDAELNVLRVGLRDIEKVNIGHEYTMPDY